MDNEELLDDMSEFESMGSDFEEFDTEEFDGEEFSDGFGDLEEEDGFGDGETMESYDGFSDGEGEALDSETASMLMDMYADIAAEAESDGEADAFLPLIAALAPMALKALAPIALRTAKKLIPAVTRGVVKAGRSLISSGAGRKALRSLPNIARSVARDQLKRVARGQGVSAGTVVRSAAKRTVPYLRDPRRRRAAAHRCHHRAMIARRKLAQGRHVPPRRFA